MRMIKTVCTGWKINYFYLFIYYFSCRRVCPPTLWSGGGGGGHTHLRLKGWGSPNSNEGTYTVVLYINKYVVGLCVQLCSMAETPQHPPPHPAFGLTYEDAIG